jgi:hypothetical protein
MSKLTDCEPSEQYPWKTWQRFIRDHQAIDLGLKFHHDYLGLHNQDHQAPGVVEYPRSGECIVTALRFAGSMRYE